MLAAFAHLREVREQLDKKQAELGAVIGLSARQYSRWETGRTKSPDVEKLFRVAAYLGISFERIGLLIVSSDDDSAETEQLIQRYLTSQDRKAIGELPAGAGLESQRDLDRVPTRVLLAELMRRQESENSGQQVGPLTVQ